MKKLYIFLFIISAAFTNTLFSMEPSEEKKGFFHSLRRASFSLKKQNSAEQLTPRRKGSGNNIIMWSFRAVSILEKNWDYLSREEKDAYLIKASECILLGLEIKEKELKTQTKKWTEENERYLQLLYTKYLNETESSQNPEVSTNRATIESLMERILHFEQLAQEKELQK